MELLKRENVQIRESAQDWRDAIRISAELLEKHGYIEPRYKEAIIENVENLGPYILIADGVALAPSTRLRRSASAVLLSTPHMSSIKPQTVTMPTSTARVMLTISRT